MDDWDILEGSHQPVLSEDRVGFALAETATVIWSINLQTGELRDRYGSETGLFNLDDNVEHITRFIQQAVHPNDVCNVERVYRRVTNNETDQISIEFRTHPENGEVRWIEFEGRVKTEYDERLFVGVATDVTERKRAQVHAERQTERSENFVGVLAHELRNPLNVASGALELAEADDAESHLERATDAVADMEALIDDLIASLQDDGPLVRGGDSAIETTEAVAIPAIVESSWENIDSKNATLSIETQQTIIADGSGLQQLFENLLRNAVEHGGSDVSIVVGSLEDQSGFYVADDGPGIPESHRENIFDTGHTTSRDGLGLGLHIVKEVIEIQGWDVNVTDSWADGARFEISGVAVK